MVNTISLLFSLSLSTVFFSSSVLMAQESNQNPPVPTSNSSTLGNGPSDSFFHRLAEAYKEDWKPTQAAGPEPVRRGYAGPLDSTPFPGTDYSVGGTPIIGAPDTQSYMLMQAINENRSRVKIYGWFNGGFDVSTSNKGDGANSPAAYYYNPNRVIPDQEVLYIERLPDTVQTKHFDWGFRIAQLYGQDYRYTTSKGVLSQQLLAHNHEYGYDPVMYYIDLYFPKVAKGMNVRIISRYRISKHSLRRITTPTHILCCIRLILTRRPALLVQ
jgi:hypothetical protein